MLSAIRLQTTAQIAGVGREPTRMLLNAPHLFPKELINQQLKMGLAWAMVCPCIVCGPTQLAVTIYQDLVELH